MRMKVSAVGLLSTLCAAALALSAATIGRAQDGPIEDLATFPTTSLDILHGKSKKDPRHFDVWIANTLDRQAQGLMFVRDVPEGKGMLFPLKKHRKMSMKPVEAVLEIKGGEASRLELKVGDRVEWTPPDECDCDVNPPPPPPKKEGSH